VVDLFIDLGDLSLTVTGEDAPEGASLADRHVVLLGGAGFLGLHLATRLHGHGARVTVVDNLVTSRRDGIDSLSESLGIDFIEANISDGIPIDHGDVDYVMQFASAASPIDYARYPIETLRVGSTGTENALELARKSGATFMFATTGQIYGDPLISPQHESYWGNVNSVGPRSVYDEAKRYGEAITMAYHREYGMDVKLPRIFNTFGPGMRPNDGRAVPAFMTAALLGRPLPVHGDGSQTRSLCYVDDLVDGLVRLLRSDHIGPMNVGNPTETSILELAELIIEITGSTSTIEFKPRPVDDPQVRVPDISLAAARLHWWPQVTMKDGLVRTIGWFEQFAVEPGLVRAGKSS
jgi:dTDP-glucose 4,6-dehydratase